MISRRFLCITLFFSLLLTACSVQSATPSAGLPMTVDSGGTYTNVTPAELKAMFQNKDFLFVNTHIPYEGEIEQTDVFIAFEENGPQLVGEYPADTSAKILLYCRSGRMSTIVAQELVKAGYINVWHLDGGMMAWEKAGYPIIEK